MANSFLCCLPVACGCRICERSFPPSRFAMEEERDQVFGSFRIKRLRTGVWAPCRARGEYFEAVRYGNGAGRVYYMPSQRIVIEGAHHIPTVERLTAALDDWLADPEHHTIVYRDRGSCTHG